MRTGLVAVVLSFGSLSALSDLRLPSPPGAIVQPVPFEQAIADLASADPAARIRALQLLRDGAFPEAAAPIARLVADPRDEVQLEAIAAELNIFLVEKIVTK